MPADQPLRDGEAAALHAAAEAGDPQACFRYGLLCAHGRGGVPVDRAAAVRWCTAAARAGLGAAQFNLGLLLAAGEGVAADPVEAARWLRLAAINGIAEAEACLDLLHDDGPGDARPRTWAEAETRASVALQATDPAARKSLRFAEYYVDPAIDLLARRYRLGREAAEDIVQQFFLEMEEPLERGEHRGRLWKDSLRVRYHSGRGAFRPFLGRVLLNFARDWMRRQRAGEAGRAPAQAADPDPVERHAGEWRTALARFRADIAARRADADAASAALLAVIGEGLGQAEAAARLGISERSLRNHLRLGGELLREWLAARIATLPQDDRLRTGLEEGLRLLPAWLHHPGAEKRAKVLLLLALLVRRLG